MASDYAVRRIACLQPSATVILEAIGEVGRVVACTRYCADVVPAVADGSRTILADSWTANAEQIVGVHPDLVIASVPYQEKAVIEILKSGARFLGLAPKNLNDIYTDIATIAGMVGASERGHSVVSEMKQAIEKVRNRVSGRARPKVFCEEWGKPVIASQTWVAELVEAAGGERMGEPGRAIPAADIAALDPDVIVAAGAAQAIACRSKRSSRTVAGSRRPQPVRDAFSASATNSSTLRRLRCFADWRRSPSPFIRSFSRSRKESVRLQER